MTTLERPTEVILADTDELMPAKYRPDPPEKGIGAMLRHVAGVKEEILDWVPEERPRYTALGAIILNTGLLAGLSLLVGLTKVTDTFWVLMVPVGVLWGYLVLTFDRWLIASTHGILGRGKWRLYLPRLVISVLMGVVIAEPLVLWIFQPAITKEVLDFRRAEMDTYESQWRTCNPASGVLVSTLACKDFQLNVGLRPDALGDQLAKVTEQRNTLSSTVIALNKEWNDKEEMARLECNGTPGPGRTGHSGEGPNCHRNRAVADKFRADSRLSARQAEVDKLNSEIKVLTAKVSTAQQDYSTFASTEIAKKVEHKRQEQGMIGLLDEDAALGRLSNSSTVVFFAQWFVRLLLVAIDCMPMFAKMIGGSTVYDELVSKQLGASKRLHDKHLGVRERRDGAASEVLLRRMEFERQARLERINEADQTARSRRKADMQSEIDALAAKLLQQSEGDPRDGER